MDTYVIIPVYNEEKVIKDTIRDVSKYFDSIICINDGSSDNSENEIRQTKAILINHMINVGQGGAIQTGIDYAISRGAKYFATFDADGQHVAEDLAAMVNEMKADKYDIILGTRFIRSKTIPFFRRHILKLASKVNKLFGGLQLTDIHNGLRVFNERVASKIYLQNYDMAHASEILDVIKENKFEYKEHQVNVVYTDYSKAKGQSLINGINILYRYFMNKIK